MRDTSKPAGLNTLCVHAAHVPDAATGAVAEPIHLATTFERNADGSYPRGYRYSREGTPNRIALEECIAQLEGGAGAAAFASGLAANMAVLELLNAGDVLIASQEGYYGSIRQFTAFAERRARAASTAATSEKSTTSTCAARRSAKSVNRRIEP